MPHYNEICIEKTMRKNQQLQKQKQQKQKQNFTSKIQNLILKTPSNNVRLQLDKTLTTQI